MQIIILTYIPKTLIIQQGQIKKPIISLQFQVEKSISVQFVTSCLRDVSWVEFRIAVHPCPSSHRGGGPSHGPKGHKPRGLEGAPGHKPWGLAGTAGAGPLGLACPHAHRICGLEGVSLHWCLLLAGHFCGLLGLLAALGSS